MYAGHRFFRDIGWESPVGGSDSTRMMAFAALAGAVVFTLVYLFTTFDLFFLLPEWFITFWDTSV